MEIKAVVFDLGGVVIEFHPIELTESFGIDKEESNLYLDAIRHPDWLEFDRGSYTKEEMAQRIFERTGSSVERSLSFFKYLKESFEVIQPTVDFIEELKKSDIDVYLLSNMNMETFNYLSDNFSVFKEFKNGVVSEDVGYCKPEKEIFDVFIKKTGLNEKEFVFLDDTVLNINKANELGWQSFKYNKYNHNEVQSMLWDLIKKKLD